MKKIILIALTWPLISYPLYAQKEKNKNESNKNESREVIIIQKGDKEKKITIETKDGEVFINGKPAKDYKDDEVVFTDKIKNYNHFSFGEGNKKWHLFNNDFTPKGYLGVSTEKAEDGVKIKSVSKDSPAEAAGLKEGDIITKVGDKTIITPEDLNDAISGHKPKDDVSIIYKRDGKAASAKALIGERPSFSKTFSFDGSGNTDFNFKMPKIATIPHDPYTMARGISKGRLGVRVEDTDNDSGVKITGVEDESLAAKSGLKENDIITEINGKKVKDVNEVKKELAEVKDKPSYNIKANRNGSEMSFEIKIPKKINKADL